LSRQASRNTIETRASLEHEVELDGLEIEIGVGFECGVNGRQKVAAVDLEAVARIEEKSDIGAGKLVGEGPDSLFHLALREIGAVDDLETETPELGGHVGRVVARILEPRGVLIGGIADDERDAPFGERNIEPRDEKNEAEETCGEGPEHERLKGSDAAS
jgi:hypothetical protein